jgi:hypothetical protein
VRPSPDRRRFDSLAGSRQVRYCILAAPDQVGAGDALGPLFLIVVQTPHVFHPFIAECALKPRAVPPLQRLLFQVIECSGEQGSSLQSEDEEDVFATTVPQ